MAVDGRGHDEGSARGGNTGSNPTDRAKGGTKRSLLTDGNGIPLGLETSGAKTHDKWLVGATLRSIPIDRPEPTPRQPQHLCLDNGYDYADVRQLVQEWGYTAHIKSRGHEEAERKQLPHYRARRWVVERTHVQSFSPPVDPLGKESRQLPRLATPCLCDHHLSCRRGFGIGSKQVHHTTGALFSGGKRPSFAVLSGLLGFRRRPKPP